MSGGVWNSEWFRVWHAGRRHARNFRNCDDPLRGEPVPQERQIRHRRRQPSLRLSPVPEPRSIFRCIPGDPSSFSLEKIAHHENLALIWQRLRAFGGQAPGSDGLTYDLAPSEYYDLLRNSSRAIRNRRYLPAPALLLRYKKSSGGFRTLELPTVVYRVIAVSLIESLRLVLRDRLPRHFGRGAGCHAILARIKIHAEDHGSFWLGVADIQNFFPSIPRALALDCFMGEANHWNVPRRTLTRQGVPWLARRLIYGNEQGSRTIGLRQGCPLSPLVSSILLQEVLDSVMDNRVENETVMHRYVDNIHIQGLDRFEVRSDMDVVQSTLLQHRMRLKGEIAQPIDVRQTRGLNILGAELRWKNDSLLFDIPNTTWKRLGERFYEATTGWGPNSAQFVARGFIQAFRPTFGEKADNAVNRIHSLLRKGGHYNISSNTISGWIMTARLSSTFAIR